MTSYSRTEEDAMMSKDKESRYKKIIIFMVTGMGFDMSLSTTSLATKINDFAKENHVNVIAKTDSASKIGTRGREADIILLTPELYKLEADVHDIFPDKVVGVINKEDYGLLQVESILKMVLS